MIRLLFILFLFFSSANAVFASHIVGGEMYYDCLGNNQYRITIKVYRDCFSTGADFDSPLPLSIFTGNNQYVQTENIPYPGSVTIPVTFNNPCVTPPNNICIQEAIYVRVITLPPSATGYILSYQRCCRGPNVQNLQNPDDAGLTLTATIPPPANATCNSSPRFNNYPPMMLCNNDPFVFDHSATDPDGDVLVYELCAPFNGGTQFNPAPNPSDNPPFSLVQWAGGFSAANPLGPGASITIDPNTGILTASPNLMGLYAVGICVKEYRNGILIGTTVRDFLFRVINCQIQLAADITPQVELSTFQSFCQGLTIEFENDSYNGNSFFWDFGVEGILSDTSNVFEPTYTFPAEGTYEVMLVVNPGWPCTDTSFQTFIVFENFDVYFNPPAAQCIVNNSFNFEALGQFEPSTSDIIWNFGSSSNPEISEDFNPQNIVFGENGYRPVNVTISNGTCQYTYLDSVLVYGIPEIDFYIDTHLMCAPYLAHFQNNSTADAPIAYEWDFGDGTTSTEANPTHLYANVGVYDITLSITVDEGCIANLTLTQEGAVDVKPSPTAAFSVDPPIADALSPWITFKDESQGGVEHWYFFSENDSINAQDAVWAYTDGGYHYPIQIVTNEWGCIDSTMRTVYIVPFTTIYVPNSFTPNNDGMNDVFLPVVRDVVQYRLDIFTRWGNVIFSTENPMEGWDGTHNGKVMGDGTYIYQIFYQKAHDQLNDIIRGHVTLVK